MHDPLTHLSISHAVAQSMSVERKYIAYIIRFWFIAVSRPIDLLPWMTCDGRYTHYSALCNEDRHALSAEKMQSSNCSV